MQIRMGMTGMDIVADIGTDIGMRTGNTAQRPFQSWNEEGKHDTHGLAKASLSAGAQ